MIPGRLIPLDSPATSSQDAGGGSLNMAVDQALLESDYPGPTLRFYRWSEPTLSLGYFQKLSDRALHPASRELSLVRRSTGGGAIVHDHELTYSLVVPELGSPALGRPAESNVGAAPQLYQAVHQSIIAALGVIDIQSALHRDIQPTVHPSRTDRSSLPPKDQPEPFLCFQRRSPWDIIVGGYKVLGSAQRRVRGRILQHGSLLLGVSRFAPELPGIVEFGRADASAAGLAASIQDQLGERLGVHWQVQTLTDAERARSQAIQAERFANEHWTARH